MHILKIKEELYIIGFCYIIMWKYCSHNLGYDVVKVEIFMLFLAGNIFVGDLELEKNCKIYFKSLLFVSLKSETEVDWTI